MWRGVAAPGAHDADSLIVTQLVTLGPDARDASWRTSVTRERGASASIDFVDSPRLTVRGPVAPQPGESHLEAQKRARVMVPVSTNFELRVGSDVATALAFSEASAPLYFWARSETVATLPHPNRQQQQFSALYATDSRDAGSFRQVLYTATEDGEGYLKGFVHEGLMIEVDSRDELGQPVTEELACYGWSARYLPTYEDVLQDPPERTQHGNTFVAPYPAVTGALIAKTDDIWFDAAERYREFIATSGMWGSPIAQRTDRSALDRGALWIAAIDRHDTPEARASVLADRLGHAMYRGFFAVARTLQAAVRENGREPRCFVHWQNIRRDGRSAQTVDLPIAASIDYGAEAINRMAQEHGISTSVYVLPTGAILASQPNLLRVLPPQFVAYDRNGEPANDPLFLPDSFDVGEPYVLPIDYGTPATRTFFFEHMYRPLLEDYGFRGFYTDVFSGGGVEPYYDPPPPLPPGHPAHGGKHNVEGKRVLLDTIRSAMRELGEAGGDPESYFGVGEGAEEFLQDRYDLTNVGYRLHAGHLMLAEPRLVGLLGEAAGFEGVPALARQMNPPLWNAVHHEWAPAQRQNAAFSNIGLATNRRFRSASSGLSPEEMFDVHALTMALVLMEGGHPAFIHYQELESPLCRLAQDGETVEVDRDVDPTGVGLDIVGLFRQLHRFLVGTMGEYVLRGRMERPLQRGDPRETDSRSNPIGLLNPLLGKVAPEQVGSVGPALYGLAPYFTGLIDFTVFDVLQSVWRAPGGELAIVLMNWTGDAGEFAARFDPSLYGLDADVAYRLRTVREDSGVAATSGLLRGVLQLATPGREDADQVFALEPLAGRRALLLEVVVEG
ncbi:MAG: hypothetical protein H6837_12600 [Planctomycetes bacterium]|nr:hypothetical protein [Planctomycetota bacterium]